MTTTIIFAKARDKQILELRPLLNARFENNCGVQQQYDFHDHDMNLTAPLDDYVTKGKYIENHAVFSSMFQLKNVQYAGIPIRKIEFSFGRGAQQFNEFLYFDLSTTDAKARFKKLTFKQNNKNNAVSVELKKNSAEVHCYWLQEY